MEDLKLELKFIFSYLRVLVRAGAIVALVTVSLPVASIGFIIEWAIDYHWHIRRKLKENQVWKIILNPIKARLAYINKKKGK